MWNLVKRELAKKNPGSFEHWATAAKMNKGLLGKNNDAPFRIKISSFYSHPSLYHTLTFFIIPKYTCGSYGTMSPLFTCRPGERQTGRKTTREGKNNKRHWIIQLELWWWGHDRGGLSVRRIIGVQLLSVEILPHTRRWMEKTQGEM